MAKNNAIINPTGGGAVTVLPPYARLKGRPVEPTAEQQEFHQCTVPEVYVGGGLGSGKSTCGNREFLRRIFRNYELVKMRYGRPAGFDYILGAPHSRHLAGAVKHLTDWCKEWELLNGWHPIIETNKKEGWVRLFTTDRIYIVNLYRPENLAAINAAGALVDECEEHENPMAVYRAARARVRESNVPDYFQFIICSGTPPPAVIGMYAHFRSMVDRGKRRYAMFRLETVKNPAASSAFVEAMAGSMSKREADARLRGIVRPPSSAVYGHEFSDEHLLPFEWSGMREGCRYFVAIDWASHFHALFIECEFNEESPELSIDIVFDEVYVDGGSDRAFLHQVVTRLERKWRIPRDRVFEAWCDYNPPDSRRVANEPQFFHDRCYAERVDPRWDDKGQGIRTMQWRLQPESGGPLLYFARHLEQDSGKRGVIKCMRNYSYKERLSDGQMVVTKWVKQDSPWSHAPDALRAYIKPNYARYRYDHDLPAEEANKP